MSAASFDELLARVAVFDPHLAEELHRARARELSWPGQLKAANYDDSGSSAAYIDVLLDTTHRPLPQVIGVAVHSSPAHSVTHKIGRQHWANAFVLSGSSYYKAQQQLTHILQMPVMDWVKVAIDYTSGKEFLKCP